MFDQPYLLIGSYRIPISMQGELLEIDLAIASLVQAYFNERMIVSVENSEHVIEAYIKQMSIMQGRIFLGFMATGIYKYHPKNIQVTVIETLPEIPNKETKNNT